MKMGKGINRPDNENQIGGNNLQESYYEKGVGDDSIPNLSPEYLQRIMREVNLILVSVKIAFLYVDSEMFREICTTIA